MNIRPLTCGFVPLVDAAPLIVAREMGFAGEEGLDLTLRRERSWSALRDKLALGQIAATQILAPAALAMSLGLGGLACRIDVLSLLSVNGDVFGASRDLAARMRDGGPPLPFGDARAVGERLLAASDAVLRIGVPFPFSMHLELTDYWLTAIGLPEERRELRTVPPPMMADAVSAGEVDLFCVGEPWGSQAVEEGAAELVLAGSAVWRFAPEKALAVRADWAEANPDLAARLMRAAWRAARWLGDPANRSTAAEFLAWPEYVGVPSDLIDRALAGRLMIAPEGYEATAPGFLEFFHSAATFPWRSQAIWMATRLARRHGLDPTDATAIARASFRADLYRRHLGPIGADLPGASEKVEGALTEETPVASSSGRTYLGPDAFFDGAVFDFST